MGCGSQDRSEVLGLYLHWPYVSSILAAPGPAEVEAASPAAFGGSNKRQGRKPLLVKHQSDREMPLAGVIAFTFTLSFTVLYQLSTLNRPIDSYLRPSHRSVRSHSSIVPKSLFALPKPVIAPSEAPRDPSRLTGDPSEVASRLLRSHW